MKVIIIVVRSKWGHKILTKEKLAEIRKSIPKGFIGLGAMLVGFVAAFIGLTN